MNIIFFAFHKTYKSCNGNNKLILSDPLKLNRIESNPCGALFWLEVN